MIYSVSSCYKKDKISLIAFCIIRSASLCSKPVREKRVHKEERMDSTKNVSYAGAKNHYEVLRKKAREAAHEALPGILNGKKKTILKNEVVFDGFTHQCNRSLRRWEESSSRRVLWDWDAVIKKYLPDPKRFELSIWYRDVVLCGASIGKPTSSGGKLRVDFIEANPDGSPLDGLITDLIIAAGITYADAIGATQIRITNPVNEAVKNHYLSKPGFKYDEKDKFCYRDL